MQTVAAILIALNVLLGVFSCFVGMRKPYCTKSTAQGLSHITLAVALVVAAYG
jgi:hypothetical protein